MIEENLDQYEEEDYEEPSSSTSGSFSRDDVNDFCIPAYDELIWNKSTSVVGQMFSGDNSKESFQYLMEYYALKEDIREVLSFRDYCYLEMKKLFKETYCQANEVRIAHMTDSVC